MRAFIFSLLAMLLCPAQALATVTITVSGTLTQLSGSNAGTLVYGAPPLAYSLVFELDRGTLVHKAASDAAYYRGNALSLTIGGVVVDPSTFRGYAVVTASSKTNTTGMVFGILPLSHFPDSLDLLSEYGFTIPGQTVAVPDTANPLVPPSGFANLYVALDTGHPARYFNQTGGSIAFSGATPSLSVLGHAPEPATWAMLLGGFFLIGGALRRQRALVPAGLRQRLA
ncbi:PEPxxWA-CTERM sorting domain-containing protein [Sphingomonas sp.]|uniref:PEPxxWA-CTERM sorting domain-containing protein n=1 Tax=Sphingomonas sp. TaxID=28214 RepID=UPI001B21C406|nr:PEPxxWA-CTERM sorting domain-containing protein [Sphingomonas sp.]MBO9713104.1 PEPxxWA-CTERM sorting domain-containing protein [Sphingomonas sp.]